MDTLGSGVADVRGDRADLADSEMKALSLFSGIGGLDLAAEWAGIKTVAFCEQDKFCQRVLAKHWPGIPIFDDVRTLKGDQIGTVDLIHGGYPCQPFSAAGKRLGEQDPRHLWPEFFRLVRELRPRWVVGENVAGHVSMGLDAVLADLGGAGYEARAFVFPAAAVGAPHRRERCFIVGHAPSEGKRRVSVCERGSLEAVPYAYGSTAEIPDTSSKRQREPANEVNPIPKSGEARAQPWCGDWWASEPAVGRVVDGFPDKLARDRWECEMRALGNAVVPYQAYPIFAGIAELMTNRG